MSTPNPKTAVAEAMALARQAKPGHARARVEQLLTRSAYSEALDLAASQAVVEFQSLGLKKHVKALTEALEAWRKKHRAAPVVVAGADAAAGAPVEPQRVVVRARFQVKAKDTAKLLHEQAAGGELFSKFLGGPLRAAGVAHGALRFTFADDVLTGAIEYRSPRRLQPNELEQLLDYTKAQLTEKDGIGERLEVALPDGKRVYPFFQLDPAAKGAPLTAEQLAAPGLVIQDPLFDALDKGDLAAVDKLLAGGADPVVVHPRAGLPALLWMIGQKDRLPEGRAEELALRLLARAKDNAARAAELFAAAERGMPRLVTALLDAGVPVDSRTKLEEGKDPGRRTPLMLAHASLPLVELLLRRGANAKAVDNAGEGALFRCASREAMKLVLDAGADPQVRNRAGLTATQEWQDQRAKAGRSKALKEEAAGLEARIAALRELVAAKAPQPAKE